MINDSIAFDFAAEIECPLDDVFAFFRDVDQHAGQPGTVVPVYDKVTPGPVGLGTRYREVVQLLPFVAGEIRAEVVCYEPPHRLGYHFSGLGMDGTLDYRFQAVTGGTRLRQHQVLRPRGVLRLLSPLIRLTFGRVAGRRLIFIKAWLEGEQGA
ncbi:MAG: SRPBCC family protein [Anaerolineae bacterium]|jgi:hypothetical protein